MSIKEDVDFKNWKIFNQPQYIMGAVAIIIAIILVKALGSRLPGISTAWLAFCFGICLLLYSRAHQEWQQLRKELNDSKRASEQPEALVRSLNESMTRQLSALTTTNGLSAEDVAIITKVQQATSEDRLELYLQPIVDLSDRDEKFYEAFSRMRDENGALLRPADYLDAVERANRIGFIDNMILLRSVQAVRELQSKGRNATVFCNISPATLYDQNFFALFTQYLDANQDLSSHLVFEFTYPAITLVDPTIGKSLELISERGFVFSIDHITRLDMNLSSLKRLNVGFVKAPASLLLAIAQGNAEQKSHFAAFAEELANADIRLIAEKMEFENQVKPVSALDIDLGQGNLFGHPLPAAAYIQPERLKEAS